MSLYHTTANRISNKVDHKAVPMYQKRSDGSGRDTYIVNSNGGNTMLYSPQALGPTVSPAHPSAGSFNFKLSGSIANYPLGMDISQTAGVHDHFQTLNHNSQGGSATTSPFVSLVSSSPNKKIAYRPDGSGRDTYITSSNGGFYPVIEPGAYMKNF